MLKNAVKHLADKAGYIIERKREVEDPIIPHGVVEDDFRRIYAQCRPYTMTTALEMYNLYASTRYVVANDIQGDFVECGVWRGGSAMVVAATLELLKDTDRRLHLYDTYEGMPAATAEDITHDGESAGEIETRLEEDGRWLYVGYDEVRKNVLSTGFASERLTMVKGKVEDTIPGAIPESIAILRLDTDFYESTYHEFVHLYPLLASGGVLIVDDYDYWKGSRQATDQYFSERGIRMLLQRMDVGRIGVKA